MDAEAEMKMKLMKIEEQEKQLKKDVNLQSLAVAHSVSVEEKQPKMTELEK